MYSGKTPKILVFEIRTVAVLVNLNGDGVLATLQHRCYVEFGWFHSTLAVACHLAVYPEMKGTCHAFEADGDAAAVP